MELKEQIISMLKTGWKKLGELVSAITKYLNQKTVAQIQQQQQAQIQQRVNQVGNYIHSELIRVFINQTVPVSLAVVCSANDILPIGVNHIHGRIFSFHFSWKKTTIHTFAQIQIDSIRQSLNQMLILGGCNFTINRMIDHGAYFELIIYYRI